MHPDERRRALIAEIAAAHGSALEVGAEPLPELLAQCRVALATSGTATLEAALLRVPTVVVYRINAFMRRALPFALLAPYVSLANLLTGQELFPEFVTDRDPSAAMAAAAEQFHASGPARERCLRELDALRKSLLVRGTAERAADAILERIGR